MKKSLLALAVLGAFASAAQAQVTIGGLAIIDFSQNKLSQGNALVGRTNYATETRLDDDFNSRFWLTGSEDLGGGLSAIFKMEQRVFLDNAATIGSGLTAGESWVGLKSSTIGTLTAGRHSLNYISGLGTEISPNGLTAMPAPMLANFTILDSIGALTPNASRIPNSLKYTSPSFSGFTIVAGYSTSVSANEGVNGAALNYGTGAATAAPANSNYSDGGAVYLQGTYANGPIYVEGSYWKAVSEGKTGTDHKDMRLSGAYTFPFGLKLGANYDRSELDLSTGGTLVAKRNAFALPAFYSFGNNTVFATYARAGDITTAAGTLNDSGVKMFTLGYDYKLSKRTHVAIAYNKLKNDKFGTYTPFLTQLAIGGSQTAVGEANTKIGLAMVHSF